MRIWEVYPAIDLRQGRVVRLAQGDPNRETEYASDPLRVARRWRGAGATWLHVVNLDGAFDERGQENRAALSHILATGLRIQFGGGLRDLASIGHALDLGVSRAVVGTAAVENPALVEAALAAFGPERVAVGIDARQGKVRTHGWRQASTLTAAELVGRLADQGVRWVIFTDVARDGMGSGLNVEATAQLAGMTSPSTGSGQRPSTGSGQRPSTGSGQRPSIDSGQCPSTNSGRRLHVIASGGVSSLDDIRRAYQGGLSGVIVGRALYEGQIRLQDALKVGGRNDAG